MRETKSFFLKALPAFVGAGALVFLTLPLAAASFCGNPIPPSSPPQNPPPPYCKSCNCTGSPCYVSSGVYVASATDLRIRTTGFPLEASRSYESTHTIDGPMGYGWTSSLSAHLYYATYLLAAPDTVQKEADITMLDGRRYSFTDLGNGNFSPPLGRHDTLIQNPDGSFDLTLERTMSVYHFGTDGSLLSTTDDYGNALVYSYDASARLQHVADASGSGRYLNVFWGADGRISAIQDHTGRQVGYAYNAQGALISVTDPLSRSTFYTYTQGRYAPLLSARNDHWNRLVSTITYDTVDRVKSYTENGETWTYTYNYQGNPLKTAKADSQGNTWIYTYLSSGIITDRVPPANSGGGTEHTDSYADGSIQQEIDEVGVKTYYSYDAQGNVIAVTEDYQGPNAVRYDYSYDPNFPGRVTSITPRNPGTGQVDPNWQAWRFDYYQAGDPAPGVPHHVYRVERDGSTLDTVMTLAFDSHGRPTSVTDAEGNATLVTYDSQGNLVSLSRPPNNEIGARSETHYSHDALGRITSMTDPMGSELELTYDALGRVITFRLPLPISGSPLSFTTTYSYDDFDSSTGLLFTGSVDPNGNTSRQGYDAYGRLAQTVNALNAVTQYAYNRDLLASVTDANAYATAYSYNGLRRLTTVTFPGGTTETYTYYADGLLKSKTDRKSQTINYAYDHFKRLVSKTFPNSTSIAYTYSGRTLANVVDTTVAPNETHLFTYDSSYRLASETQGPRGTVNYTYTPAGHKAGYSVVGGASTAYSYYPDSSLDTITWSEVAGSFKYSYNPRGQFEQILFPNGQHRDYSYDDQGRLVQIANLHPTAGNLATFTYGYDMDYTTSQPLMLGQRTSMSADVPAQGLVGALTKYYYDKIYRLTRADYPNVAPFNGEVDSWIYDAIGNRLAASVNGQAQAYTYEKIGTNPNNLQRLLSDGSSTYSYDLNGNLTSRSNLTANYTLTWDTRDRLAALSGSAVASYGYDHLGRRISQAVPGATTSHLYSQFDVITDSGSVAASYLSGPGVDQPLAVLRGGIPSFYAVDGLGSAILSTDIQGATQTSSFFDAWGSLKSHSGNSSDPFAFTGREFGEGDMLYFRNRWLLPSTGRFVSEDPLYLGGGPSLYSYVDSDPTNAVDPFGLCARDWPSGRAKDGPQKHLPGPKYPPGWAKDDPQKHLPAPKYPPPPKPPLGPVRPDPPHWEPPPPWVPLPLVIPPVWSRPDPLPPFRPGLWPEWPECRDCIVDPIRELMEEYGEQLHDPGDEE